MRTRLNDRKLLFLGPLVLWAVATVFFNLPTLCKDNWTAAKFLMASLASVYFSWFMGRWLIVAVRHRNPGLEKVRQRLIALGLLSIPAVVVLVIQRLLFFDYFVYSNYPKFDWLHPETLFMVGLNLFYLAIIFAVYESRYFFREWLISKRETEELSRANLEMQLDSLKNQVQPHFLFNSLNTLQALVKSNENKTAVKFIGDLSQVYRYLLQSNEQQLISLEKELEFTHAYFGLLKTRFEDGISLEVNIDPAFRYAHIPPLTLQLLVENAVKHNIVSVSKPLHIKIFTNKMGELVVQNNLQCKPNNAMPSSQKGLVNITSKYSLLRQPQVQIYKKEDVFEVKLPLIDVAVTAGAMY
ncbi:sensor histidine kinase [Runella sp. SP2]|uniref:sensor histidine kinase n=1 Tax=Runella sp. SP2 TaxID=2268026 RepID=UPI000F07EC40|nr:histidine kinase [Runella sp. SP2]AYQ33505.1 histidine kinase [Runella sp. SP2]